LAEARYAIALAAHGRRLGIAWTPDLCDWVDRLSECDGPVLLEGPTGWPFEAVAHQAFRMADECWTDVWVRGPCMDVALPVESLASLVRGQVGSRVVVPPRVVVSGFWETEAITQHAVVGPYRYPKDGRVLVIPAMPESGGEVWMQFKRCRYEFPLASTRWLLDPGAWSRGWIPPLGLSRDPTA